MICQRMMVGNGDGGGGDVWQFTVNTEATAAGEKKTGIPFNLYGQDGVTLDVDWGDGTTSRLTSADYTSKADSLASVHEYDTSGVYIVTVSSGNWDNTLILTCSDSSAMSIQTNANAPLYYWQRTLVSVDTPVPASAGRNNYSSTTATSWTIFPREAAIVCLFQFCAKLTNLCEGIFDKLSFITLAGYVFRGCSLLASLPSGLFDKCPEITNFMATFQDCKKLTISNLLFDKNTKATSFENCFYGCTSLSSIPSGFFNRNTLVTTFNYCFYLCRSLASIPEGLFDKNTMAKTFSNCFTACPLAVIPSGLFQYNTAATGFYYTFRDNNVLADFILHIGSRDVTVAARFVTLKSGVNRTIYVPTGSTTETTFNAVASDLGLTIIGE